MFHPLTVRAVYPETDSAVSVVFDVPEVLKSSFAFQPGQYLTVRHYLDGEEIRRCYSICSGLDEKELRIAIKAVPYGRFSTFATTRLQRGDVLDIGVPDGRFCPSLNPDKAESHVFFAAGSGITPILSIIRSILVTEPCSQVTLFYGNRRAGSILFREALDDLKNRYISRLRIFHVLSLEHQEAELLNGRLDHEKIKRLLDVFVDVGSIDGFWICGPAGMAASARSVLFEHGVPADKMHFELFSASGADRAGAENQRLVMGNMAGNMTDVALILDGRRHYFRMRQGDRLLDAGLDAGLDLPFSCRSGVCATCRVRMIEGGGHMNESWGLTETEMEAGFVLACQLRPSSERLIVDFDAI